jgi:hypothetical protein
METSSDGKFTLEGLPGGSYTLTVTADGYGTWTSTLELYGDFGFGQITLYKTSAGIDEPSTYTVTGTVVKTIGYVEVLGVVLWADLKLENSGNVFFAQTLPPDGKFTFAGVPAGSYILTVSAAGYETYPMELDVYQDVYFEWIPLISSAQVPEEFKTYVYSYLGPDELNSIALQYGISSNPYSWTDAVWNTAWNICLGEFQPAIFAQFDATPNMGNFFQSKGLPYDPYDWTNAEWGKALILLRDYSLSQQTSGTVLFIRRGIR